MDSPYAEIDEQLYGSGKMDNRFRGKDTVYFQGDMGVMQNLSYQAQSFTKGIFMAVDFLGIAIEAEHNHELIPIEIFQDIFCKQTAVGR